VGRAAHLRRIAQLLLQTLHNLEQRPDVDQLDPAFISLKSSMLVRALDLRAKAVGIEAGIHLVERPAPEFEPEAEYVKKNLA
jgi:hypothetical protein